jgi:NAD(P)-dependent dehydrogenase (short-subunit alcohol dehydrogenase family)
MAAMEDIRSKTPNAQITFISCDLSSFASIQRAANTFNLISPRLDLLFCNAAVCLVPRGLTQDGYEIHFGINHLGHALLIKLLMPTLLKTVPKWPHDVRIMVLSTCRWNWAPEGGIIIDDLQTTQPQLTSKERYGQSKLANILYARELARKYRTIRIVPLHPGIVDTDIMCRLQKKYLRSDTIMRLTTSISRAVYRKLGHELLTPEEGARNSMWAATAPRKEVLSGIYYDPIGVAGKGPRASMDRDLAVELWEWTEKELNKFCG